MRWHMINSVSQHEHNHWQNAGPSNLVPPHTVPHVHSDVPFKSHILNVTASKMGSIHSWGIGDCRTEPQDL